MDRLLVDGISKALCKVKEAINKRLFKTVCFYSYDIHSLPGTSSRWRGMSTKGAWELFLGEENILHID